MLITRRLYISQIGAITLDRYRLRSFTILDRSGTSGSLDGELFAADVALASAAAPLFFPAFRPRRRTRTGEVRTEERTYVDGGVWANNPALLAVMEAHRHWAIPFKEMHVISVGNGEVPTGSVGVDFNGMRRAKMLGPIIDMMFATQSELADQAIACLVNDEGMNGNRMLRVNVPLDRVIELDDVQEAVRRLKPLAEQEARTGIGRFRRLIEA